MSDKVSTNTYLRTPQHGAEETGKPRHVPWTSNKAERGGRYLPPRGKMPSEKKNRRDPFPINWQRYTRKVRWTWGSTLDNLVKGKHRGPILPAHLTHINHRTPASHGDAFPASPAVPAERHRWRRRSLRVGAALGLLQTCKSHIREMVLFKMWILPNITRVHTLRFRTKAKEARETTNYSIPISETSPATIGRGTSSAVQSTLSSRASLRATSSWSEARQSKPITSISPSSSWRTRQCSE